jgi:hypothetical protein
MKLFWGLALDELPTTSLSDLTHLIVQLPSSNVALYGIGYLLYNFQIVDMFALM